MVKLQKLIFEGFRTPDQVASVVFSKESVTVIFGDNGCGKTTYLRAINAFLSQDSAYLEAISVRNIYCEYMYDEVRGVYDDEGDLIEQEIIREDVPGDVWVRRFGDKYDWTSFESSALLATKSLSLGVERGVATQQVRIDTDILLSYFMHPRNRGQAKDFVSHSGGGLHELAEDMSRFIRMRQANINRSKRSELSFDSAHVNLQNIKLENIEQILLEHYNFARKMATRQIQNALFDTLAVVINDGQQGDFDISRSHFVDRLRASRVRLTEALDDDSSNKFKDMVLDKLKNIQSDADFDGIFDNPLLKTLLWNMMGQLTLEALLLNSVNLLVDKFNNYLIDDKKLRISDNKVFIEVEKRELQVGDLSSGERHILTFLTLVLFQGRQRNFLIIDEPEISLNIKWQRELMGIFQGLAPNTQIIVASHSPALAKKNPAYLSELRVSREALNG